MNTQVTNQVSEKRLYQIQDEYKQFLDEYKGETPVSLEDFAKAKDEVDGEPARGAAYNGTNWFKDLMASEERLVAPISENVTRPVGKYLGGLADSAFGTGDRLAKVGDEIGSTIVPDVLEQTAFTLSGLLPTGVTQVAAGASAAGKLAKYGNLARKAMGVGAMANTAGRTYAQTDSVGQGAIQAAFLPVQDFIIGKTAGKASTAAFEKFGGSEAFDQIATEARDAALKAGLNPDMAAGKALADNAVKGAKRTIGAASLGAVGGSIASNELQRQASLTWDEITNDEHESFDTLLKRHAIDAFSAENIAGNVFGGALSANLPAVVKGVYSGLTINPELKTKMATWYGQRLAYFDQVKKARQFAGRDHLSMYDAVKNTLDPQGKEKAIDETARKLAGEMNGDVNDSDMLLFSFMKETKPTDVAESRQRIDALDGLSKRVWGELAARRNPENYLTEKEQKIRDKLPLDEQGELLETGMSRMPDQPSLEAIKQLEKGGFIDMSQPAIEKRLSEKQKMSLTTDMPEELYHKVIVDLTNQLEYAIKTGMANMRSQEHAKQHEYVEGAIKDVEGGIAGASAKDARHKAKPANIAQADAEAMRIHLGRFIKAIDEIEALGNEGDFAAPVLPDKTVDDTYTDTMHRPTVTRSLPIAATLKEAFKQLSAKDGLIGSAKEKIRAAQFASDIADWWEGAKKTAQAGVPLNLDTKVKMESPSLWLSDKEKGQVVQMSLRELLATSARSDDGKTATGTFTGGNRKLRPDFYESVTNGRVFDEMHSDKWDKVREAEGYTPGEYTSSWEHLREMAYNEAIASKKRLTEDEDGNTISHETPEEQAAVDAAVAEIDAKRDANLERINADEAQTKALQEKVKGLDNESWWNILKPVFLTVEGEGENRTYKPSARQAEKAALLDKAIPAMLEWGRMLDSNTSVAKSNRNIGPAVKTFLDAYKPGWETMYPSVVKSATMNLNAFFRSSGAEYMDFFNRVTGHLRGDPDTFAGVKDREAVTTKKSGKSKDGGPDLMSMFVQNSAGDDGRAVVHAPKTSSAPSSLQAYALMIDMGRRLGLSDQDSHFHAQLAGRALSQLGSDMQNVKMFKLNRGAKSWADLPAAQKAEFLAAGYSKVSDALGVHAELGKTSRIGIAENGDISMSLEDKRFLLSQAVNTVVHEVIHRSERQALGEIPYDRNNPAEVERVNAMQKAMMTSDALTQVDKATILNFALSVVHPLQPGQTYHSDVKSMRLVGETAYGSALNNASRYEFLTVLGGNIANGLLNPESKYKVDINHLNTFMPNEIALYNKGVLRDVYYNLSMLNSVLKKNEPDLAKPFTDSISNLKKVIMSENVREAEGLFQQTVGWLTPGVGAKFITPEMSIFRKATSPIAPGGIQFAAPQMPSGHGGGMGLLNALAGKGPESVKVGFFRRNLVPFLQVMDSMKRQGVQLADDAQSAFSDFTQTRNKLLSRLWKPFLERTPEGQDVVSDKGYVKVQQTAAGTKAINEIFNWMQVNAQGLLEKDPQGRWVVSNDPTKQATFNGFVNGLSVPDRYDVISAVGRYLEIYNQAATDIVESKYRTMATNGALIMLKVYNDVAHSTGGQSMPHTVASDISNRALTALRNNDIPGFQNAMAPVAAVNPDLVAKLFDMWAGKDPNDPNAKSALDRMVDLRKSLDKQSTWFASQQRPGRFILVSRDATGLTHIDSAENKFDVKRKVEKIKGLGFSDPRVYDKFDSSSSQKLKGTDVLINHLTEAADEGFLDFLNRNPLKLDPATIDTLRDGYRPSTSLEEQFLKRGVDKALKHRELVPAALGHDYIKYTQQYINGVAESISRRDLTERIKLVLADDRATIQDDFRNVVQKQLNGIMAPNSSEFRTMKALTSAYYLALNLSSMVVEGAQMFQTLAPTLIQRDDKGGGPASAYKHMMGALSDLLEYHSVSKTGKQMVFAREVAIAHKISQGQPITPEESRFMEYRKAFRTGELSHSAITDKAFAGDQQSAIKNAFSVKDGVNDSDTFSLFLDKGYLAATHGMKLYSMTSNMNNKVAMLAGLRQGQAMGLKGEELYNHARNIKHMSMFGGGKVNQPGYINNWSNDQTRAAVSAYHTLQQYGMAMVGHYAQMIGESLPESIGSKGVPPALRAQARKALATTLATQVTVAGTMGLPFLGSALTAIEKTTGIDADQAMREWWDELGQFTPWGHDFADIASTGLLNHLTGVDAGSRMGLGGYLGTSYYNGFSLKDFAGPMYGIAEQVTKAAGLVSTGEPLKALHTLLPNGLKGAANLAMNQATYGDSGIRDNSNRLIYTPSTAELGAMSIGFRPKELTKRANLSKQLIQNRQRENLMEDHELDGLAQAALQGDYSGAQQYALQAASSGGGFPAYQAAMRKITDRVTAMTNLRDYTEGSSGASAESDQAILNTYDDSLVRGTSNLDMYLADAKNAALAGVPPTQHLAEGATNAAILDQLMNLGLSRPEAVKLAGQLSGAQ